MSGMQGEAVHPNTTKYSCVDEFIDACIVTVLASSRDEESERESERSQETA